MATYTYYKASARGRCWKQHTCCACGCVYRYKYEQSAEATGGLAEIARENVEKKLVEELKKGIKSCPCPGCGLVQPDMAAKSKILWHSILACVPFVLLFVVGPAIDHTVSRQFATIVAVSIAGVVALGHLLTAVDNPNRDREANKQEVEREVAAGRVQMVRAGAGSDVVAPPRNFGFGHLVCLLIVMGAAGAFLLPEHVYKTPPVVTNPGLKPTVIVPGTEFTVTMDRTVDTVAGLWNGTPEVKVLNPIESGVKSLSAGTNNATWGTKLRIRSSERHVNVAPWVKLTVPKDPALTGKTIQARVTLAVAFPQAIDGSAFMGRGKTFLPRKEHFSKTVTVHIADGEVHSQSQAVWSVCCFGGLLASVLVDLQGRRFVKASGA
jgi:hypothetical protein